MCSMRGCFWRLHGTVGGSRVYLISVNDDLKVQAYSVVSCLLCEDRVDASYCRRARPSLLLSSSSLFVVRWLRDHAGGFRVPGKHVLYSGRRRCLSRSLCSSSCCGWHLIDSLRSSGESGGTVGGVCTVDFDAVAIMPRDVWPITTVC